MTGFYLFIAYILFIYVLLGWLAVNCPVELTQRILNENNSVKTLALVSIWPILLIIGICIMIRNAAKRLYIDAKKLIPQKAVVSLPKKVTVADLEYQEEPKYQPGKWMQ